ncbi:MAG: hypothetical protein ACJ763_01725 [Bdellovibrionia bacterium]
MKKVSLNRMHQVVSFLIVFVSLQFLGSSAFADSYFHNNRLDATVPANCREMEIRNFYTLSRFMIYGIQGARAAGFTHEYPITRRDAESLWGTLKSESLHGTPKLTGNTATLYAYGRQMGFDFVNEGEVLELLAILQLKQEYPDREYFLTGSVAYGEAGVPNMGELDIVVARRSDCGVVAVGEAKLGVNQRPHAAQQLRRFMQFLQHKLCLRGEKAPVCTLR